MAELLETQREYTRAIERRLDKVVPFVFHRNCKPINGYLDGWRAACKRAAVEKRGSLETVIRPRILGRTPHDFRRTAARNLIRAGVAQHLVMQLCGWKTDSMFRRYAIVDERDLRSAVEMLAKTNSASLSGTRRLHHVSA
jgi:integrase